MYLYLLLLLIIIYFLFDIRETFWLNGQYVSIHKYNCASKGLPIPKGVGYNQLPSNLYRQSIGISL